MNGQSPSVQRQLVSRLVLAHRPGDPPTAAGLRAVDRAGYGWTALEVEVSSVSYRPGCARRLAGRHVRGRTVSVGGSARSAPGKTSSPHGYPRRVARRRCPLPPPRAPGSSTLFCAHEAAPADTATAPAAASPSPHPSSEVETIRRRAVLQRPSTQTDRAGASIVELDHARRTQ
jgi:hypothetical protein